MSELGSDTIVAAGGGAPSTSVPAVAAGEPRPPRSGVRERAPLAAKYATVIAFVVVVIVFSVAKPDAFATWGNWKSMLNLGSAVIVMAAFLTVPMIIGDFDLSIGYHVQLMGGVAIVLMTKASIGFGGSILLTLAAGVAAGTILGVIVVFSRASAFVITLAGGIVMLGIELKLTNQTTIFSGIPANYHKLGTESLLGLPIPVWIMAASVIVLAFFTEFTVTGRKIAAAGDSREAARLSGINVTFLRILSFTIVGLGAAIAGVILTAQAGQYYPNLGVGNLLPAYAAVFLGAATLRPGRFHVLGTFVGAMFLQVIQTGLVILDVATYVSQLITGIVLIVAVVLTRWTSDPSAG